jgi:hypothetical protein
MWEIPFNASIFAERGCMDNQTGAVDTPGASATSDSVSAAASIQADLVELIRICDRALNSLQEGDAARESILKARAVAERGMKLSDDLLQRLRTN